MRKICKLMFKCLCVMLPLFLLYGYFWMVPPAFFNGDASYYRWNKEIANKDQEKYYKTIILGDSSANAAYVPEILSGDTINLALVGTTPMENYYILQDWLDHNKAPEICYISFQDYHLQTANNFWAIGIYSGRYSLEQEVEMLKTAAKYKEQSVVHEDYIIDYISYKLRLPNKYITSFISAISNQRYGENIALKQLYELHGGRYMARTVFLEYDPTDMETYTDFSVEPLFDDYYRKIIELCDENNVTVRIVKLPSPDNVVYTNNYADTFYQYYDELKKEYPNITVDFFPAYEEEYFMDAVHLNSHGALRFSMELKGQYTDDFDDSELSSEQVEAINDSIKNENKVEQIIKWIYKKNYTVILYDRQNRFQEVLKKVIADELGADNLNAYQIVTETENELSGVCYISGINGNRLDFSAYFEDETLVIQLTDKEPFELKVESDNILGVIVLDNYNQNVVCTKLFKYVEEGIALVQ